MVAFMFINPRVPSLLCDFWAILSVTQEPGFSGLNAHGCCRWRESPEGRGGGWHPFSRKKNRKYFADFIRNMEYLAIFAIGVYCLWAVDGKHICLAMVFASNQSVYHLIFTLTKQEMTHEDNYRFSCLQQ